MDQTTAPPVSSIDDLFTLQLVDGLPAQVGSQTIHYRVVRLRETTVADERAAARMAERVVTVGGQPRLLASDADFKLAMTTRHIAAFVCDAHRIDQAMIDLDLIGKLSGHDLGLIERRVFLIALAAEVRYGTLTQDEFEAIASGRTPKPGPASPQPVGQAAGVGAAVAPAESGPALLADFARSHSDGPVALDGC